MKFHQKWVLLLSFYIKIQRQIAKITGYFRNKESGVTSKSFVGQLINDELKNIYYTTQDEHFYDFGLKALELSGYTDFSKKWSILNFLGDDLNSVQESNDSLAKRWKYYAEKK